MQKYDFTMLNQILGCLSHMQAIDADSEKQISDAIEGIKNKKEKVEKVKEK